MEFGPALWVTGTGLAAMCIVLLGRLIDSRMWRRSLDAYRIRMPHDASLDSVTTALAIIAGQSRRRPIVFEVSASSRGIAHYLLVPRRHAGGTLARITAAIPGARLEHAPDYLIGHPGVRVARELRTSRTWQPLATDYAYSAITGVLASLYPLAWGEIVRLQWIFSGSRHIHLRGDFPAHVVRDVREKQSSPLLSACGRIAVSAGHRSRARLLLADVLNALSTLNAPGVALRTRVLPTAIVVRRIYDRSLPLTRWPGLVNSVEAVALICLPVDGMTLPGVAVGTSRQLPPPMEMPRTGLVIARSNYPGIERALALRPDDRLRHVTMLGPTGVGKTVLLARMALQDIAAGYGTVVIDPKSDLIDEILRRIPENRLSDVIVMNPALTHRPIGFNVLKTGRDEHARELVVDRVVHVLSEMWRSSWGPRTADVLRSSLLSLVHVKAPDGNAFTLTEVPELLTNSTFRRYVARRAPESVADFWQAFEAVSDAERAQWVGPALNKLRAFSTRTSLRLMLGQSGGLDLSDHLFRRRGILLVPLSKGIIGPDAAHLLGALLVALLWQATLGRAAMPAERRRPVFAYLDEFQEVLRFGGEMADVLAQARGLGLGLVLAHQYLDQLSSEVLPAVLGTVRTQIAFQLEYRDAEIMAKRFSPLTREDLTGLDAFEIAARPCVSSRTMSPVTGRTLPLDTPLREPAEVQTLSLDRYGTDRAEVEAARKARLPGRPSRRNPFGRTPEDD